jgi:hypothetical protein
MQYHPRRLRAALLVLVTASLTFAAACDKAPTEVRVAPRSNTTSEVVERVTIATTSTLPPTTTTLAPPTTIAYRAVATTTYRAPTAVSCPNGSYVNSSGNTVCSPYASPSGPPTGASAKCNDGTYSFSEHRQGTCSGHGGVAEWY